MPMSWRGSYATYSIAQELRQAAQRWQHDLEVMRREAGTAQRTEQLMYGAGIDSSSGLQVRSLPSTLR